MINNISIATENEIICIGDDVNKYPVIYPRQLSFGETVLIGKKIPLFRSYFCQFLVGGFGNSPMATKCICNHVLC